MKKEGEGVSEGVNEGVTMCECEGRCQETNKADKSNEGDMSCAKQQ